MSDDQCLRRLRFWKDVVTEIYNLLQLELELQTRVSTALSVASKVTIALNLYATDSVQAATTDICNISQFAAHTAICEVTDTLYRRTDCISFSMTREHQLERQTGFMHIACLPRVQGVIDCIHVALTAPHQAAEQFRNRKGFLSLNVQLDCDHNCKILQVDAQYPGSTHDSFILHQSGVPSVFTGPNEHCGWLLGDKGQALSTWLMTSLRNLRTDGQVVYNERLTATRTIIEHTIGILKQRFHCLDRSGGVLQYLRERVSRFMVVCCMLHNLATMRVQPLEGDAAVAPVEEEEEEAHEEEEEAQEEEQDAGGQPHRRRRPHPNPAREAQHHLIAAWFT
uniref:putative nuclease HARBI1 n=1 Tax=Pristiophorus japonicus TaxID=55135 RepID=UPI00398F1FAD